MGSQLRNILIEISNMLSKVAELLPSNYELLLVARNTENSEAHIVVGDCDYQDACEAIQKVGSDGDRV